MKTILAILALSSLASAGTRYEHYYQAALGTIALENACITATTVESKTPVRQCVKLVPVERNYGDTPHTEWVCEQWQNQALRYPRNYTVTECTDLRDVTGGDSSQFECFKYEKVTKFLPATIKVSVVTEEGEYTNWPGIPKNFTFPACK